MAATGGLMNSANENLVLPFDADKPKEQVDMSEETMGVDPPPVEAPIVLEQASVTDTTTKSKEPFKVEIPRLSSSKLPGPSQRSFSPTRDAELEQHGPLFNGPGAKRDLNKSILKIRTTELADNLNKARKHAMEQSARFALAKQQQQQQKQQLELIKKQQALLLMCRIYVGSIFYDVKEEAVRTSFSAFGPIRSITMSWDAASGKHKGFAFIEFETPEAAQLAHEQMNGVLMGGRNIKVGRPSNMPQAQPIIEQMTEDAKSYSRIYVASIHPDLNESDVQSVFEAFGPIRTCNLVRDVQTGKHKGYGFIEYGTMSATLDAIKHMNMFDLGGQLLRVGRAVTPPETSPDKVNQTLLMNHLQASGGMVGMAPSKTTNPVSASTTSSSQASSALAAAASAAANATAIISNNSQSNLPTSKENGINTSNNPSPASTQNSSQPVITATNQSTVSTSQTKTAGTVANTPSPVVNNQQPVTANSVAQPPAPAPPSSATTQSVDSSAGNPAALELTENQKKLLQSDDPQATLEQQVELTVRGKEQRLLLMQKLMRRKAESRVAIFRNMVTIEDLDEELENEITDECEKYGQVERVLIYQERQGEEEDAEVLVKIFVEFVAPKGAEAAVSAVNGRYFGGRVVRAELYDQEAFDSADYSA